MAYPISEPLALDVSAMQAQAKVGAAGRLIWYGPLADQGFTAEKALMKMAGFDVGPVRLPQLGLTRFPQAYQELKAKLVAMGVLDTPGEDAVRARVTV